MSSLERKTILITGGTGSFGYEMAKYALEKGASKIIILSRDEYKQYLMRTHFKNNEKIRFVIGDVRDYSSVIDITKNVDVIFHAAAMKRVEVCEEHVQEAIKTNVNGTLNVAACAGKNNVGIVINLSADKAINPSGVYGLTKSLSEKIFEEANKKYPNTKFINLRYSNVLGSRGSVTEIFEKKLLNNETITVFDKTMSRLFLTQLDIMQLCEIACEHGIGGEIFLKKAPLIKILDLAEAMKELVGSGEIRTESKLRPGEKDDATLVSKEESKRTYELGIDFLVIIPSENDEYMTKYGKHKKFGEEFYGTQNAKTLNKNKIKQLLAK
jgi:FlaA1/EpsC-like NDP-sugar epimerase